MTTGNQHEQDNVSNATNSSNGDGSACLKIIEQDTAKYYMSSNDLIELVNKIPLGPHSHQNKRAKGATGMAFKHPTRFLPNEISVRIVQYLLVPRIQMKHVRAIGCSSQYIDTIIRRRFNNDDNERNNQTALLATTWWMPPVGSDGQAKYIDFSCIPPPSSGHPTTGTPSDTPYLTVIDPMPWMVRLQSISIDIVPHPTWPLRVLAIFLERPTLVKFVVQRSKHKLHPSFTNSSSCSTSSNNPCDPDIHDEGDDNDIDTTRTIEWETISPIWILDGNKKGYQTFTFPNTGVDVTLVRLLCLSTNQIEFNHQTRETDYPYAVSFNLNGERDYIGLPYAVSFRSIRFN